MESMGGSGLIAFGGYFFTLDSVYTYMHFYACPYCRPNEKSRLVESKVMESSCDHKKTFFGKDKECKEDQYKCKIQMACLACKEVFKISEEFLEQQKRKIKDG